MEKIKKIFMIVLLILFVILFILIYEIFALNESVDNYKSFCEGIVKGEVALIFDAKSQNIKIEDNDIKYDVEYGKKTASMLKYFSNKGYDFNLKMNDNSFNDFRQFCKKYLRDNDLDGGIWKMKDNIFLDMQKKERESNYEYKK